MEKDGSSTILYPENFLLKIPCVLVGSRRFCGELSLFFFIHFYLRLASFHSLSNFKSWCSNKMHSVNPFFSYLSMFALRGDF